MSLQLRDKTPKRKVKAKLRDDRAPASAPNECWSMDFLSDQLFDGRKILVLSIIDNFSRAEEFIQAEAELLQARRITIEGRHGPAVS